VAFPGGSINHLDGVAAADANTVGQGATDVTRYQAQGGLRRVDQFGAAGQVDVTFDGGADKRRNDCGQDADDDDNHHHLDEGETAGGIRAPHHQ